jgi:hypothetical protein
MWNRLRRLCAWILASIGAGFIWLARKVAPSK